ncbi:hypothetical protein CLF_111685 [Clonorchis sinensis]|uniref:Uncharacterized protein n=1 Tax=Clonorchis sinensis TaxID=79923 RepID=G7YLW6_CLOSI|nr:hypothetical protein CLF_111685 [Clonorchis sinensis]
MAIRRAMKNSYSSHCGGPSVWTEYKDAAYERFRLCLLRNLCADVLLGHDFLGLYNEIEIPFGDQRDTLTVFGVTFTGLKSPSLSTNLTRSTSVKHYCRAVDDVDDDSKCLHSKHDHENLYYREILEALFFTLRQGFEPDTENQAVDHEWMEVDFHSSLVESLDACAQLVDHMFLFYEPNFDDPIHDQGDYKDPGKREQFIRLSLVGGTIDGIVFQANKEWCLWAADNLLPSTAPTEISPSFVPSVTEKKTLLLLELRVENRIMDRNDSKTDSKQYGSEASVSTLMLLSLMKTVVCQSIGN